MSIVVRYQPANLTSEQYDESIRRLEEAGLFPADGLDHHLCFGSDGNLLVSEIWDSREQFDAFGKTLRRVLTDVGVELAGEPEMLEVHNIIQR